MQAGRAIPAGERPNRAAIQPARRQRLKRRIVGDALADDASEGAHEGLDLRQRQGAEGGELGQACLPAKQEALLHML